jgi:hypothetical protein
MIKRLQTVNGLSGKLGAKEIEYCLKVLTSGKFYESEIAIKDSKGRLLIVSKEGSGSN